MINRLTWRGTGWSRKGCPSSSGTPRTNQTKETKTQYQTYYLFCCNTANAETWQNKTWWSGWGEGETKTKQINIQGVLALSHHHSTIQNTRNKGNRTKQHIHTTHTADSRHINLTTLNGRKQENPNNKTKQQRLNQWAIGSSEKRTGEESSSDHVTEWWVDVYCWNWL